MQNQRLRGKDLITIGIFSVIYTLTATAASAVGLITPVYPFVVPISMIPCGIVWVYMRMKAPKRFAIAIQAAVEALLLLLMGTGWPLAAGILFGGLLAEIIVGIFGQRKFGVMTVSYIVFGLCSMLGSFLFILLAKDAFIAFSESRGAGIEHANATLAVMTWPALFIAGGLVIIAGILGILLGRKVLKKHFVKSGIL
jgi:energy-coupling factor transport system substrate-specific component